MSVVKAAVGSLVIMASAYVLMPQRAPEAQAQPLGESAPKVDAELYKLQAQYVAALEQHYIPAKVDAEQTGNWPRAYEVARSIGRACTIRAAWDASDLEHSTFLPEDMPGIPVDWRSKTVSAAREVTACIQIVRAEAVR